MKIKLLSFLACAFFIGASSQVAFEQNVVIDQTFSTVNPSESIIADIDNDGDQDVLVIVIRDNGGSQGIALMKNIDGLGNYEKPISSVNIDGSYGIDELDVGDIDGDGFVDLIFMSESNLGLFIMWAQNDGTGFFEAPQQLFELNYSLNLRLQVVDIDGDGDNDIGFGNSGYIGWLDNDNTSFSVETFLGSNFTNANNYDSSHFIDIDNDNRLDVIVDYGYDLRAFKHETDGTLSLLETMSTFAQGKFVTGGDIDGDGDNDIVRVFENGGGDRKVKWYQNTDGLGTFANSQTLFDLPDLINTTVAYNAADRHSLILKDVDGINGLDIIFQDASLSTLSLYKNLGSASFASEDVLANDFRYINSIDAKDINSDGSIDIVTTSRNDDQVSWFNNTDGLGDYVNEIRITSSATFANHVDYGDIDGDGDLDLVSSSHGDSRIAWYENVDGEGNFSNIQELISITSEKPRNVFLVDIDGDDDNDVLAYSYLDSATDEYRLIWFENDGSGNFSEEQLIYGNLDEGFIRIDYADVDGDTDIDIMAVMSGNLLLIFRNNGDGTFAVPEEIAPTTSSFAYRNAQFEDVDGDNDIDLLVLNNEQLIWYDNATGTGDYITIHVVSDFNGYQPAFDVADIDGDNDMDIIFSNKSPREIGYFANSNGTATTYDDKVVVTNEPFNPWIIKVMDMDNDGDEDIITNSETGQKFMWYPNDGMAGFGDSVEISNSIGRINHITSADINNDGKIDLITSSYDDDKVAWFKNLGPFTNTVSGTVRLDANADGCDASDLAIPNVLVATDNGTNSFSTFTQADGSYTLQTNQEIYSTSIISGLPTYYTSDPLSDTFDFNGLSNANTSSNFCAVANQVVNDVNVVIYPSIDEPRPGFDTTYQLVYKNNGSTILNGTIDFQFDDSKITFLNASETVSTQTGNSLSFSYSNLVPFETRTINIAFNVFASPTTNIDDVLNATAVISPTTADFTEDDNTFNLEQVVIGSYDPNDIRVLEGEEILIEDADKYLHYIIRFQNTGTASAINVRVNNILDNKFDWSTMQLESMSHSGRVEITDGNNINFIFDNINLPDSISDEPNSHGFIAYKIKPKNNVVIGDVFSSTAAIYFDFNPPIITNTATTEIANPLSILDLESDVVRLYPNPVNSILTIESKDVIDLLRIYDVNGRLLRNISEHSETVTLEVSSLVDGMYFLEIKSGERIQTLKFIKK